MKVPESNKRFWRIGDEEIFYISKVIKEGLTGKYTRLFEEKFSQKFNIDFSIAVNSGTSALHTALLGLGVKPGDEVIVPPLTFIATAYAPLFVHAVPVFADVDPYTFNICPKSIEKKITNKTKAIIVVSLYGLPPDMDNIMKIAKKNNLKVLEDNAECVMGEYKGKIAGTIGHASIFSFQRSKHLTTGDGGMITTKNPKVAERCRKFADLGYRGLIAKPITNEDIKDQIQDPNYKRHELIGYNYRMPELCAAVGLAQLDKIDLFLNRRIATAEAYHEVINNCNWLIPQKVNYHIKHSYWTYAVRIDTQETNVTWNQFRKVFMSNSGEKFYGAWSLSYLEPSMKGLEFPDHRVSYTNGLCPIAESIQPNLIQFKTNFDSDKKILEQREALKKTIDALS